MQLVEHNSDQGGAKYTRFRKPVKLVYSEPVDFRTTAARREYQLKKMSLAQKRALIKTTVN